LREGLFACEGKEYGPLFGSFFHEGKAQERMQSTRGLENEGEKAQMAISNKSSRGGKTKVDLGKNHRSEEGVRRMRRSVGT